MYQRYLADPASVDPAWHDFFADYRPHTGDGAPAAPVAPAPEPARPTPTRPGGPGASDAAPRPDQGAPAAAPPPADVPTAPIRGVAARIAQNMEASLHVPTATSVRSVPAK